MCESGRIETDLQNLVLLRKTNLDHGSDRVMVCVCVCCVVNAIVQMECLKHDSITIDKNQPRLYISSLFLPSCIIFHWADMSTAYTVIVVGFVLFSLTLSCLSMWHESNMHTYRKKQLAKRNSGKKKTTRKKQQQHQQQQQHISINLWLNRETFRFQMVMMMNGIKFN